MSTLSQAIPGAVDFTKYADSKGVKVFYISNRDASTEKDTRENMEKLGFPMGGNVDTFLMQNEKPDWGSAKSTRRDYATLCDVPLDIDPDELDHRIEVFGEDPNFGSRCTFVERVAAGAA